MGWLRRWSIVATLEFLFFLAMALATFLSVVFPQRRSNRRDTRL